MVSKKGLPGQICLIALIASMTALALPPVYANGDQYYMGAYFHRTRVSTDRVVFSCNYYGTDPDVIPSYTSLLAVSTVAGADGIDIRSNWMYQNVFGLHDNGEVWWYPQCWYAYDDDPSYRDFKIAGDYDYLFFFGRTQIKTSTDEIVYTMFAYEDDYAVEHDAPVVKTFTHEIPSDDDKNFLVNSQTLYAPLPIRMKYFQTGVESVYRVTETWYVDIRHMSYKSGSNWIYKRGYSIRGNVAYWGLEGLNAFHVGGWAYTGVNKNMSSADRVRWEYTGSTIGNDVQLWSQEGSVDKIVDLPFN